MPPQINVAPTTMSTYTTNKGLSFNDLKTYFDNITRFIF
jgi:hypothetical protein